MRVLDVDVVDEEHAVEGLNEEDQLSMSVNIAALSATRR
jgi:hypothetical protein